MKIKISRPVVISEIGKRSNQEDTVYPARGTATSDDRLFMVCDGMGGHEKGEVASAMVCEAISEYFADHCDEGLPIDAVLNGALEEALNRLDASCTDNEVLRKMGTTLVLVYLYSGGCVMAHIGDSRVYHIRPKDRRILYKSRDHSLVYDLFLADEISYEEMKTHPKKNVINRALMPDLDERPTASITHTTDIQAGDCFFLFSDGMLEQMTDAELVEVLGNGATDEETEKLLIAQTGDNSDNHSAILIRVEAVEPEDGDDQYLSDEQTVKHNAMHYEQVAELPITVRPMSWLYWLCGALLLLAALLILVLLI